jgi:hypothetical protein
VKNIAKPSRISTKTPSPAKKAKERTLVVCRNEAAKRRRGLGCLEEYLDLGGEHFIKASIGCG